MDEEIIIKPKEILALSEEGKGLIFHKDAEEAIIKLLEWKEKIEDYIKKIEFKIEEDGISLSPDFKGILGAKIKAVRRFYGDRYTYDKTKKYQVTDFLKEIKFYKADPEKIEAFLEENHTLPEGIIEKEREPKIKLSVIEHEI